MPRKFVSLFLVGFGISVSAAIAQQVYFVDGYHGGVYGHYPRWQTKFMVDQLKANPDWKINLEIESETWDSVRVYDPPAYLEFQVAMSDPEMSSRIDIVNPSYGQSYLFNISGESIIRQFDMGIQKMEEHFPGFTYSSYSSEEPCFTSALPQILKSFGIDYAVLKNPNTCWGGYTKAFGGELVNWIGPDGTKITAVPRYKSEAFESNSTWQTTAWGNSENYIHSALDQGIAHPVGMCLQDAGWEGGPWLGAAESTYQPSQYVTWTEYFEDIVTDVPSEDWDFSQEDVQVSLVWGSQVLQRLAQQVRVSENKVASAEKLAAYSKAYQNSDWPTTNFDEAWRVLLLSQHHDCWIVPYNHVEGSKTWADKVAEWTDETNRISQDVIYRALGAELSIDGEEELFVNVFNSQGSRRKEFVTVDLSSNSSESWVVEDENGKKIPSQVTDNGTGNPQLTFRSDAKPIGISTYRLTPSAELTTPKLSIIKQENGFYSLETDYYLMIIDPAKGGVINSLLAKKLSNKELVDPGATRGFNELRGFFYEQNKFLSSTDTPAVVEIMENGDLLTKIAVKGYIGEHPFTQTIALRKGDRKIDFEVQIDWKGNPGIGEYSQMEEYEAKDPKKAFYNDEYKLLVHFPLNLENQQIYKNAPFDVTKSKLESTFFTRWDSIKNNVMLNWVDLIDEKKELGVALFTDHTTSYAHSADHPLALNIQYSGRGLWGMDYKLEGPTHVNYALVPHQNQWDEAGIWMESVRWNEPLLAEISSKKPIEGQSKSMIELQDSGWEITSVIYDQNDLIVRFFNAEGDTDTSEVLFNGEFDTAELVALNGDVLHMLPIDTHKNQKKLSLKIPQFGIRTIKLKNFR